MNAGSIPPTDPGTASVAVVDGVFPTAFCRFLLEKARGFYRDGTGFPDTNRIWPASLREGRVSARIHTFDDQASAVILGFLKMQHMLSAERAYVMLHAWPAHSSIPWHNDGGHDGAATVYLNERWEPEWGGHFLYRLAEDGEQVTVVPQFNRGVRNEAKVLHRTTPVTKLAPEPRFSLQAFGIAKGEHVDPKRRAAE